MSDHEGYEDGEEGASDCEKEEEVDEAGSEGEDEAGDDDEDEAGEDKEDDEREATAIVALQRATRGRLARQRVKKLKELQEVENNIADVDLDIDRVRALGDDNDDDNNNDNDDTGEGKEDDLEATAIVALQRATRGRLARQRVKKLKELQEVEDDIADVDLEMQLSAKKLQKSIRGRLARQKVDKIRQNNVHSDAPSSEVAPTDGSDSSNDRVRTRANDVYRRLLNRQQIRRNKVDNTLVSSELSNEPVLQDHVDPLRRTNSHSEILGPSKEISHDEGDFSLFDYCIRHSLTHSLTHSSLTYLLK